MVTKWLRLFPFFPWISFSKTAISIVPLGVKIFQTTPLDSSAAFGRSRVVPVCEFRRFPIYGPFKS